MSVLTSLIKTLTKKHLVKAAKKSSKPKKDRRKGPTSRRSLRKADEQETNQRRAGYPGEARGNPAEASSMKTRASTPRHMNKLDVYRESSERGKKVSAKHREVLDRRNPKDRRK